ncbi:MAG: hypothetical protein E4H02_07150 [Lentisphaerales bacterium]|jgi:hypothetical protein|nr:MAG: hypothetical protein E4H02_07150 [Lentisphaerales bacterium]
MKQPPDIQKLEETLNASKISAGGFMGSDRRPLQEILEADASELVRLGHTTSGIADRMRHIMASAERGLGSWVQVDDTIQASATDTRGVLPCPWPHPGTYLKTAVVARNTRTGKTIRWSALSIHLIEEHGFFEGQGSAFRLEPDILVDVIF